MADDNYVVSPTARTIAISVIDYCHRLRAYFAPYHFPFYYHPVSKHVRKWVGIETDKAWDNYITQVGRLYPLLFLPLISNFLLS